MTTLRTRFRLGLERLEDRSLPAVGGGYTAAGLLSEYFANNSLSGSPSFTRHDVRIDFNWGISLSPGGSTSPGFRDVGTDQYSIRWSGSVISRFSENYTFTATANDGVRLYLRPAGGSSYTTVIDQWNTADTWTGNYTLVAGQAYDIVAEYRELTGSAQMKLQWSSASTPLEVIDPLTVNGYHVDSKGIFMFADAMKTARATWGATGGGSTPVTDANGWPMGNGEMVVWEGAQDAYFGGTYNTRFTGQATVTCYPGGGGGIRFKLPDSATLYDTMTPALTYTAATNTTEFQIVVPSNVFNSPFVLRFNNSRRLATDPLGTGITNLEIMRPRTIGGNDPYAYGTLYTDVFKEAASPFTQYRFLDVNGDLSENDWNQRVLPSYNRGTYHSDPNPTIEHKGWVYEYQIQFANETGKDLYLTVPMRATNDYFQKLAQLIRYGSRADGSPATSDSDPLKVYPGLNPNLHVYMEVSNEVWNSAGPFGQTRQADDDAVAAGLANNAEWQVINYDGALNTTDTGGYNTFDFRRLGRWYALRTVRMSEQFRTVFGDAAMNDRIRPVLYWQYNNANNTAFNALQFLDDYFNNGRGNNVATPRPLSYYLWGAGGASYYGSGNSRGTLASDPITNPSFDINGSLPLNQTNLRPTSVNGWTFIGNSGVYGRPTTTGQVYTSEGRSMGTLPNPVTGDYAGYVMRGGTMSREITFTQPGRYAIGFTARTRNGWQYDIPLDFILDGTRVTPQYKVYRGTGEVDPASGPAVIGYSWNINTGAGWVDRTTTSVVYIDVPLGGCNVSFSVAAQNITAVPGDWDYDYQRESYALFDNFYVGSVDRIFEGGIPDTGQALGQVGTNGWFRDRNEIAQYAQAYGVHATSYESGWSLGGDDGASPLQNYAKYRDDRARIVNTVAIDAHAQSGYGQVAYGVYEQWRDWDLANAAASKLRQGFVERNSTLPVEANNGRSVPLSLKPNMQTLGYTGSGSSWSFSRNADATLGASEFLTFNIIVPTSGQYQITAHTGTGGNMRLLLNESELASGTSGTPRGATLFLTKGLHTLKLRSTTGSFTMDRIDVTGLNAPNAPVLNSAVDADSQVSLNWSTVSGAVGYLVRYGTTPGNYTTTIDVGTNSNRVITGLTNNQTYYFAISAYNANGIGLPSNEMGATPLAEGQLGNLALWEFSTYQGGEATAPVLSRSSRVNVADLTRGPGLRPADTWVLQWNPQRFSSFSSNNVWAQDLPTAITRGQYYTTTLTPVAGQVMSLDTVNFAAWFSNTAEGVGVGATFSTDGTNFTQITATGTPNTVAGYTINFAGVPAVQNTISDVILRFYLYGSNDWGANAIGMGTTANDVTVRGSVKTIPNAIAMQVNDGAAQRSMVKQLFVTFNTLVNLNTAPFEVRPLAGGNTVPITWSTADVNGQTIATISFTTGNGSIGDGRWRLTTIASQVSHRVGSAPLMSVNRTDDFFRLFGDANGDARVNATDMTLFRAALGSVSGSSSYRNYFDFNNDGRIDNFDFTTFRANLGREV